MKDGLFRKKSMEKIVSPEQLNDYITVSTPAVWLVLSCIVLLLTGMCVWGVFGSLETVIEAAAVSSGGKTVCYVREEYRSELTEDMTVRIGDTSCPVLGVSDMPVQITENFDAYLLHIGGLETGEWVYEVTAGAGAQDGVYKAELVTESIAPISFLLN